MRNFYKSKRVLITGHTGFQGAWLSELLLRWGAEVIGVAKEPHTNPSAFELFGLRRKMKHYVADIRDYQALKNIMEKEKPEIVFHLAAQAVVRESYDNPLETHTTNIVGTANVLHAIQATPSVKAAVIVTTDKVYQDKGEGVSYKEEDALGGYDPYGASKAAADIVAQSYIRSFFHPDDFGKKHQTLFAIARSGNVIGGGDWAKDRLVPDIIRAVYEEDGIVRLRNPQAIRPWQHVFEALYGYLLLAQRLYEGNIEAVGAWNFGPEKENALSVLRLTEQGLALIGRGSYEIHGEADKPESEAVLLDAAKAKAKLGWASVMSFEETLRATFQWYQTYHENRRALESLTDDQIRLFHTMYEL